MLGQLKCLIVGHNDMQIQGVCQNKYCKQPQRRICLLCIKDHKKNDQSFDYSDIKSEQEIQLILNEFKQSNIDRINKIALQCYIQQYLLNVEIIEQVKLWNYKYNEIHQIQEKLQQFQNNQWNQISLHYYLNSEKRNISINEYLQQYLQELFYIDDLKNDYIKNIIKQKNCGETNANTEQEKFSIYVVQKINKFNNQLFQNIIQNDLFKQKHQKDEKYIITICELMIRQGYDLKTDAIFDQFQVLKDIILDNTIERYKYFYIQSYAIAYKQQSNEQQRVIGLQLINQSMDLKDKYAKSLRIKGLFYFDFKRHEDAIQMFNEAIKIDPLFVDAYNNKGAALHCLQRYQQAIEMYDEAIKIDPKFAATYCNKGSKYSIRLLFSSLHKYQSAIEMYDEAIKIDPKFADAYYGKGNSLYNLQEYQIAIEMYDQAIKIDRKFADAYFNKANSLYQLKQYNLSKASFEMYLDFYPNDDDTKQRIKKCEQQI